MPPSEGKAWLDDNLETQEQSPPAVERSCRFLRSAGGFFLGRGCPPMNRPPAFQFYPEKWLAHTLRLSAVAYRVYHRMLCWMWNESDNQYTIPSDPEFISVALNLPREEVEQALREIQYPRMELLKKYNDFFVSNGLKKSKNVQQEKREKSSYAGRLSGISRRNKGLSVEQTLNGRSSQVEPKTNLPTPIPTPIPTPVPKEEDIPVEDESLKLAGLLVDLFKERTQQRLNYRAWVDNFHTVLGDPAFDLTFEGWKEKIGEIEPKRKFSAPWDFTNQFKKTAGKTRSGPVTAEEHAKGF